MNCVITKGLLLSVRQSSVTDEGICWGFADNQDKPPRFDNGLKKRYHRISPANQKDNSLRIGGAQDISGDRNLCFEISNLMEIEKFFRSYEILFVYDN